MIIPTSTGDPRMESHGALILPRLDGFTWKISLLSNRDAMQVSLVGQFFTNDIVSGTDVLRFGMEGMSRVVTVTHVRKMIEIMETHVERLKEAERVFRG